MRDPLYLGVLLIALHYAGLYAIMWLKPHKTDNSWWNTYEKQIIRCSNLPAVEGKLVGKIASAADRDLFLS